MTRLRARLFVVLLLISLIYLQYRLWFQDGGIQDYFALKSQVLRAEQDNQKLKKVNELLLFQIKRLQNNNENVEERARNDLGMIKKDEIFYQVSGNH